MQQTASSPVAIATSHKPVISMLSATLRGTRADAGPISPPNLLTGPARDLRTRPQAAHTVRGAAATSLLHTRRVLPSTETKPGKAPKNVDYIGEASLPSLFSPSTLYPHSPALSTSSYIT